MFLFQFLMKKYVIVAEAKKKMSHAMVKMNNANAFLGSLGNRGIAGKSVGHDDDDDDDDFPCGACEAIRDLKLDQDSDECNSDNDDGGGKDDDDDEEDLEMRINIE